MLGFFDVNKLSGMFHITASGHGYIGKPTEVNCIL